MGKRIAVIGNLNIDLVMSPVDGLPDWGQERTAQNIWVRPAGSAGYSALALGKLGMQPVVFGNVGQDAYGRLILDALTGVGADTSFVRQAGTSTGISIAMVRDDGQRAFLTYFGNLSLMSGPETMTDLAAGPDLEFALFSGYFLLPRIGPDHAVELLRGCRAKGAATLLDVGSDPANWAASSIKEVEALLAETDIFLPNEDEAEAITGLSDPQAAATALLQLGPKIVIVKLGGRGSLYMSNESGPVFAPAVSVSALDTTGAGDVFNAAAIYALAHGWSPARTLRFANAAGAYAVARMEDRFPALADIQKLLDGNPGL